MGKGAGCNQCWVCNQKFEDYTAEEYARENYEYGSDEDEDGEVPFEAVDRDTCPDCLEKQKREQAKDAELVRLRAANASSKQIAATMKELQALRATNKELSAAKEGLVRDGDKAQSLIQDLRKELSASVGEVAKLRSENEQLRQAGPAQMPAEVAHSGASPTQMPAEARSLLSPSRWVLRPVTAEAGSAPYLLAAQPTVIGRAQNMSSGSGSQSQSQGENDDALKITINATNKAGISRTHAKLKVSDDGESLTIVGESDNPIKIVKPPVGASASAEAPQSCKQGEAPLPLAHNDLLQLDGWRTEPQFVFRVQQLTSSATSVASPPDDAPEGATQQPERCLKEAQARISQLEQQLDTLRAEKQELLRGKTDSQSAHEQTAASMTVDLTADDSDDPPPAAPRKRKAAAAANGSPSQQTRQKQSSGTKFAHKSQVAPTQRFAIKRNADITVEEFDEEDMVDCYGSHEIEMAQQMVRDEVEIHESDVMETDDTGIITLVFSSADEANKVARERFLEVCSDWGKEFDEEDEEEEGGGRRRRSGVKAGCPIKASISRARLWQAAMR
eukprot:SAG31_NODE_1345_length_8699_cov_7.525116_4_plen_560_part_00